MTAGPCAVATEDAPSLPALDLEDDDHFFVLRGRDLTLEDREPLVLDDLAVQLEGRMDPRLQLGARGKFTLVWAVGDREIARRSGADRELIWNVPASPDTLD